MNPLSIKVNDYLIVSFTDNSKSSPLLITAVTPSTVNGQKSYAVTAGGVVYTCTYANTVVLEKSANQPNGTTTGFVSTWVLSA